jgi:MATE family multidrug resistance protein
MVITIAANIVNIILNYIWIYGKFGMPAMGLLGAGYATLTARIIMPLIFTAVFFSLNFFRPDRENWRLVVFKLKSGFRLLSLGSSIAGQYVVEVLAFSLGSIMMGWLGAKALAAHQIVLSLASFTFMVSSGFAAAATIKVSHFRGEGNSLLARNSVFASLHQVLAFMTVSVTFFCLFRFVIPGFFIADEDVIAIAGLLMLIAGMFQLFDGLQVVMLGGLRGYEDVRMPMVIVFVSYFIIALPIGYLLAFTLKLGPTGIWFGYLIGLITVSALLFRRFRRLSRGIRYSVRGEK